MGWQNGSVSSFLGPDGPSKIVVPLFQSCRSYSVRNRALSRNIVVPQLLDHTMHRSVPHASFCVIASLLSILKVRCPFLSAYFTRGTEARNTVPPAKLPILFVQSVCLQTLFCRVGQALDLWMVPNSISHHLRNSRYADSSVDTNQQWFQPWFKVVRNAFCPSTV